MAKYKEKFIVINTKRFDELNDNTRHTTCSCREAGCPHEPMFIPISEEIKLLLKAIKNFNKAYEERIGKKINQKYYVCNQDEPYAQDVIDIILKGEDEKQRKESSPIQREV